MEFEISEVEEMEMDGEEYTQPVVNEYYQITGKEEEEYHNLYIGCLQRIGEFIKRTQEDQFSLLELVLLVKQIRYHSIAVQKWDSSTLGWIKDLKTKFHKIDECKKDIQNCWFQFLKIMDQRSAQFNDKLIAVGEIFIPFYEGLKILMMIQMK